MRVCDRPRNHKPAPTAMVGGAGHCPKRGAKKGKGKK